MLKLALKRVLGYLLFTVIFLAGARVMWTPPAPTNTVRKPVQSAPAISTTQMAALTPSITSKFTWDTVEGVRAEVVAADSRIVGQPTLRLIATDDEGRHAAAVRFELLPRDHTYQVVLWVKGPEGSRIMVEERDGVDPKTGKPEHYGVAHFDLSAATTLSQQGDIRNPTIEVESDGWRRVSVGVRSNDGRVFALLGMLEGDNNHHIFKGARKYELTIGGIEIKPI